MRKIIIELKSVKLKNKKSVIIYLKKFFCRFFYLFVNLFPKQNYYLF